MDPAKIMNPQTMLDAPEREHQCYPCMTTYSMLKHGTKLEPGESWDDPVVEYQLWRGAGMCDKCARKTTGYDGPEKLITYQ